MALGPFNGVDFGDEQFARELPPLDYVKHRKLTAAKLAHTWADSDTDQLVVFGGSLGIDKTAF